MNREYLWELFKYRWNLLWDTSAYDPYELCRVEEIGQIRQRVISDLGTGVVYIIIPFAVWVLAAYIYSIARPDENTGKKDKVAVTTAINLILLGIFVSACGAGHLVDFVTAFLPIPC